MNKEELIRNLKYTEKKHINDTVNTFGTDISMMCSDVLRVLENCIEIPKGSTCGDVIKAMFPDAKIIYDVFLNDTDGSFVEMRMVYSDDGDGFTVDFPTDFWFAPYKKEVE